MIGKAERGPEANAAIREFHSVYLIAVGGAVYLISKARQQTQAELADKLGIDQVSVSAIENRSDLLLSTLAKYVRALGGDVEIRAVFPEATFNLEPLLTGEIVPTPASVSISSKRRAVGQKSLGGRRRVAAVVS
jgi:transcriptional regulator with XRE-family HTH domain